MSHRESCHMTRYSFDAYSDMCNWQNHYRYSSPPEDDVPKYKTPVLSLHEIQHPHA